MSAVRSSTQEARVARGVASYASFVLSKLPCFGSASYPHERTLMYEPIDNNGNWTEWSAIWAEIVRVISKSNELAVRVQFEITSMIADQICTTRSSISTLLHPFWNPPNFIDVVVSWFEVKFIHFFLGGGGGGGGIRVLETKVPKFATWMTWYSLSFIFLQFHWFL